MAFLDNEFLNTLILGTVILVFFTMSYLLKYRRMQKGLKDQLQDAKRIGADRPLTQHPIIDPLVCIGCGTCVAVCPEGSVLGVIAGKATIINGAKCVGHALCEENCPVGALTVGLGDVTRRDDIPVFNEMTQESSVPGLYLTGEITGISLIKNAILHAARAVDAAFSQKPQLTAVIGSGPAGLAAVLGLKERGMKYLWLDQEAAGGTIRHYPRQKLTLVQPVTLPLVGELKKGEYYKEELMSIWEDAIANHGLELRASVRVDGIFREKEGGFTLQTSVGELMTDLVILAVGRRGTPRKLGVPGEESSKVAYSLEDASAVAGRKILVIGGGDSAVEAAMGLAQQPGNEVTVSYRRERFFRIKARNEKKVSRALEQGDVKALFNSGVREILDDRVLLETEGGNIELDNDLVYIFAGGEPPWPLLKSAGLEFGHED